MTSDRRFYAQHANKNDWLFKLHPLLMLQKIAVYLYFCYVILLYYVISLCSHNTLYVQFIVDIATIFFYIIAVCLIYRTACTCHYASWSKTINKSRCNFSNFKIWLLGGHYIILQPIKQVNPARLLIHVNLHST